MSEKGEWTSAPRKGSTCQKKLDIFDLLVEKALQIHLPLPQMNQKEPSAPFTLEPLWPKWELLEKPDQTDLPPSVQYRYFQTIQTILRAFEKVRTGSRLLITSRYQFTVSDGRGGDLVDNLDRVHLRPMEEYDQIKQMRAAARLKNLDHASIDSSLMDRVLKVASGNPGLQALFMKPILNDDLNVAVEAINAIEYFLDNGVPPEEIRHLIDTAVVQDAENAVVAFFKRMAFDTYKSALTSDQMQMLRVICLFSPGIPLPHTVLHSAGMEINVEKPDCAIKRLLGLGLVDDWGELDGHHYAAANPLARPLVDELDKETISRIAENVLPILDTVWRDSNDDIFLDHRAIELVRLALLSDTPNSEILDHAAAASARYCFRAKHDALRAYYQILQPYCPG